MGQDDAQLGAFDAEIVCETPNNLLNKFEGRYCKILDRLWLDLHLVETHIYIKPWPNV